MSERRVPIVTAVLAIALAAVLIFGATALFLNYFGPGAGSDTALHLDGPWEIEGPTYNDEYIFYVFSGDAFSSVTESMVYDTNHEGIEDIKVYYRERNGATVASQYLGDGNFLLRIALEGTFLLEADNIMLVSGEGMLTVLPFTWERDTITIDGYRFRRR